MNRAPLFRSRLALALLAPLVLGPACSAVGPDYAAPTAHLPAAWQADGAAGLLSSPPELARWWQRLGDPLLDQLVERAVHEGLDVRAALARLRAARALRGAAAAELYPSVDGTLAWRRSGESQNTPIGEFVPDTEITSAGFDASWEIDLWGRLRRSLEAAEAELGGSLEDARDVTVTVTAEVARNYVELRAFQQRLRLARTNVALQEETLALVGGRFEAGLVGEIDVAQARTNLASTRARVPALEAGRSAAGHRLAVLLGQPPGALADELDGEQALPVPPASVAVGLPADLLRRRADVRRAERALAAESARIGMAEAELYPRLTLTGNLGLAAEELGDLGESESSVFGLGPSLRWNVFSAGRLRARVQAQEARTEEALAQWERTVLGALEECENAMTRFVREQERRGALGDAAAQARLSVELARAQYGEGLSDFQDVLVSERALAELEDELAASEAAVTTHLIALYKALGGGWEDRAPVLARAD